MSLRQQGNAHFQAGRLDEAGKSYTEALEANEADKHLIYSNHCLIRIQQDDAEGAVKDARAALAAEPSGGEGWAKGWFRLAQALEANVSYREAADAADKALRWVWWIWWERRKIELATLYFHVFVERLTLITAEFKDLPALVICFLFPNVVSLSPACMSLL